MTNEQLQSNETLAEPHGQAKNVNTNFESPIGRGPQPDFSPSPEEVAAASAQVQSPAANQVPAQQQAAPAAAVQQQAAQPAPAQVAPQESAELVAFREKAGLFDTLMADPNMATQIDTWAADKLGKPPVTQQPQSVPRVAGVPEDAPDWARQLIADNAAMKQHFQTQAAQQANDQLVAFKAANPDVVKYEQEIAGYITNQGLSLQDAYILAKGKGNGVVQPETQTVEGHASVARETSAQEDVAARIKAIPSTDGDRLRTATKLAFDAAIKQQQG